jgi:thiazole tautomerase (transcriptional regulator TenI)
MPMKKALHVISTGKQSFEDWLSITVRIHPWVDFIHIRERHWSREVIKKGVMELEKHGVPLTKIILNNELDLALQLGVLGVHFPERSSEDRVHGRFLTKGYSVHSVESAMDKQKKGAQYLIFGHIYPTKSKPDLPPRGLAALETVASAVQIPVIAIGGITPHRVSECLEAGASGVAVLSGVYEAESPEQAAKAYKQSLWEGCLYAEI